MSSLAKTGARTFEQNLVWPPEVGDLQMPWRTDKQTKKHTQKTRLRKCVQIKKKIKKKNICEEKNLEPLFCNKIIVLTRKLWLKSLATQIYNTFVEAL